MLRRTSRRLLGPALVACTCAVLTGASVHAPRVPPRTGDPAVVAGTAQPGPAPADPAAARTAEERPDGDQLGGVPDRAGQRRPAPGTWPAPGAAAPAPTSSGTTTAASGTTTTATTAAGATTTGGRSAAPGTVPTGAAGLPAGAVVQEFTRPVALGDWPGDGSAPAGYPGILSYPDGTGGRYHPSQVLSVHDGVLDWYCSGGRAAAVLPFGYEGFTYGTYTVRMRTEDFPGYHIAFLLWPVTDQWTHELDGPEGETYDSHPYSAVLQSTDPVSFAPAERVWPASSWHDPAMHDYTWQWGPGSAAFYQDGVLLTRVTSNVPDEPMRPVLQVEWSNRLPEGQRPDPAISGHVYVDRFAYDPRWTVPVS